MMGLVYDDVASALAVSERAVPSPAADEVFVKVVRAGICSTDIEITRGYVPGYQHVLGHEFVGVVEQCASKPELVGKRCVGEINCNCAKFTCADVIFQRNHAPGRTVLGIIGKDGTMANYLTLPVENLHMVPEQLSDQEACYAEPLAAACRIIEQGLLKDQPDRPQKIAVVGDGKLGLLIAQVLACKRPGQVTLFGRHDSKMSLVQGLAARVVVTPEVVQQHSGTFDLAVEASGASSSISTSLGLIRPLGTLVLKSTVSLNDPSMPGWSELANQIVVDEKVLVGSRCGPLDMALEMLAQHAELRQLVNAMTQHVMPLSKGVEAMQLAQTKGVLKVQLDCQA